MAEGGKMERVDRKKRKRMTNEQVQKELEKLKNRRKDWFGRHYFAIKWAGKCRRWAKIETINLCEQHSEAKEYFAEIWLAKTIFLLDEIIGDENETHS